MDLYFLWRLIDVRWPQSHHINPTGGGNSYRAKAPVFLAENMLWQATIIGRGCGRHAQFCDWKDNG
jgi:hypothetical protein